MVLSLSMNADAAAQKHRHTPRMEQVDSTKNNQNAIEAFSDTTATADDAEDEYSYRSGTTYSKGDVEEAKEIIDSLGGLVSSGMIVGIVAIVVIFLLAPLLIIFLIFYFVNKNRRERYKLAQMAMQNGQPIPDDVLKGNQNLAAIDANDDTSGLRQIFLGIGLSIFLGIVAGKIGFGIGALMFFIGLGKVVIAKKSNPGNDPLNNNSVDNFNNPSNDYNNE